MKGIEMLKTQKGMLKEIRVSVAENPELAEDVRRLISIKKREHAPKKTSSTAAQAAPTTVMTLNQFRSTIREAKQSGEITESEFFQTHPEWQKKEQ